MLEILQQEDIFNTPIYKEILQMLKNVQILLPFDSLRIFTFWQKKVNLKY